MRFTIRDLLWLTVVVALGVGLWVEHSQRSASDARRDKTANRAAKLEAALLDSMGWRTSYETAYRQFVHSQEGGYLFGISKSQAELPPELRKSADE